MKKFTLVILSVLFLHPLCAQLYDPGIDSLINEVSEDSLVHYVRVLSGEDSVYVNGEMDIIKQRVYDSNDLAADYLMEKLASFGLNPIRLDYDTHGTNVVAYQYGTEFPEEIYMICAHYDGVTYYCADDNASGTAAVLEAARVLSNVEFPYTIAYALWDEEEIGLIGSHDYAETANEMGMNIGGVLNIDMIGWDSNDDGLIEIHSNMDAQSAAVANVLQNINTEYNVGLDPVLISPGASASDHSSFWDYGYGAVLLIEGYWSGDFNPYYHSPDDRIDIMNIPYFWKASQMAIGSLAEMATQDQYVSINEMNDKGGALSLSSYPNPFTNQITIQYELNREAFVQLNLVNQYGQVFQTFEQGTGKGSHSLTIDGSELSSGLYTVIARTDQATCHQKILKIN